VLKTQICVTRPQCVKENEGDKKRSREEKIVECVQMYYFTPAVVDGSTCSERHVTRILARKGQTNLHARNCSTGHDVITCWWAGLRKPPPRNAHHDLKQFNFSTQKDDWNKISLITILLFLCWTMEFPVAYVDNAFCCRHVTLRGFQYTRHLTAMVAYFQLVNLK